MDGPVPMWTSGPATASCCVLEKGQFISRSVFKSHSAAWEAPEIHGSPSKKWHCEGHNGLRRKEELRTSLSPSGTPISIFFSSS